VHGNQTLNTVYVTEDRPDSFLEKMAKDIGARSGDVVCFGHTHKPWQRTVDGVQFVNTGSVGRPKDGDRRACYVLLTLDQSGTKVEFVRVPYDVDHVASAIRESGLPSEFAEVLKSGGASPAWRTSKKPGVRIYQRAVSPGCGRKKPPPAEQSSTRLSHSQRPDSTATSSTLPPV